MSLSPSQSRRYWVEWRKVEKALARGKPETEAIRKEILAGVGCTSMKDLDHDDLDACLDTFVETRVECGERLAEIQIKNLNDKAYWERIARDRFGHAVLANLDDEELAQLQMTLINRTRKK